jgi:ATP-dependent Clp protease ATP-binding subunit ClpA
MFGLSRDWFTENNFTQEALRAFQHTFQRSCRLGASGMFFPVLLLWSMLRWEGVFGVRLLSSCGVNQWNIERDVEDCLHKQLEKCEASDQDMKIAKSIATSAIREATALNQQHVGTEHIMLALLAMNDEGLTGLFTHYGLSYDQYKTKLIELERSWEKKRTMNE